MFLRATQTASQVQVRLKASCSMLGQMARVAAGEMIQTGGLLVTLGWDDSELFFKCLDRKLRVEARPSTSG